MSNFDGNFISIVQRKIFQLVESDYRVFMTDLRNDILQRLNIENENPAYIATRNVSFKNSGQLDNLREEAKTPSFEIEGGTFEDKNKPSNFAKDYQVSEEFVNTVSNDTIPESVGSDVNVIIVNRGNEIFARIVIPVPNVGE